MPGKKATNAGAPNAIIRGKKEGLWVTYYANGHKRSEGAYKLGLKHGRWMQYHQNGLPASEATFHEGKYVGIYRAYHENGNLQMQGEYNPTRGNSADGTKEGEFRYYNTDGRTVWRIITYKRGSRSREDQLLAERDY